MAVGHTKQKNINLQNLTKRVEIPIIYCDCRKGNLQDFNLTTGQSEDLEITQKKYESYSNKRYDNLKIALGILNYTVNEMKPFSEKEMKLIWENQNLLTPEQKARISHLLPIINDKRLLVVDNDNIKENLKIENFKSQDPRAPRILTQNQDQTRKTNPPQR